MDRTRLRGVVCIIGCCFINLTLGTLYSIGNLNPYIVSYFKFRKVSGYQEINTGTAVWIFAIAVVFQSIGMIMSGPFCRALGNRFTVLIGAAVLGFGNFMGYYAIQWHFAAVILLYGSLVGTGLGLQYGIILQYCAEWFPDCQGLVTGIAVGAFGLGSLVFTPVQLALINPSGIHADVVIGNDRLFSDNSVLDNVPPAFLKMGAMYLAIQLIGSILISSPPKDYNRLNEQTDQSSDGVSHTVTAEEIQAATFELLPYGRPLTLLEALKTPTFHHLWWIFVFMSNAVIIGPMLYKAFGETFIHDDVFLTVLGAVSSVGNCLGRVCMGFLADKVSIKHLLISINVVSVILYVLVPTSQYVPRPFYFAVIVACFFTFSGLFVLMPLAVARIYGLDSFPDIVGALFVAKAFSGILSSLMAMYMVSTIGWWGIYSSVIASSVIALVMLLCFRVDSRNGQI